LAQSFEYEPRGRTLITSAPTTPVVGSTDGPLVPTLPPKRVAGAPVVWVGRVVAALAAPEHVDAVVAEDDVPAAVPVDQVVAVAGVRRVMPGPATHPVVAAEGHPLEGHHRRGRGAGEGVAVDVVEQVGLAVTVPATNP
jgi:hypothetical protein